MPAALGPSCWAQCAAAKTIDDRTVPPPEWAAGVEQRITALAGELMTGSSSDPVRHALVDTAQRWRLDLSEPYDAMTLVQDDAHGRRFADWSAWRSWGRGNLLPWFDQVCDLFDKAGTPVALRVDTQEVHEEKRPVAVSY